MKLRLHSGLNLFVNLTINFLNSLEIKDFEIQLHKNIIKNSPIKSRSIEEIGSSWFFIINYSSDPGCKSDEPLMVPCTADTQTPQNEVATISTTRSEDECKSDKCLMSYIRHEAHIIISLHCNVKLVCL